MTLLTAITVTLGVVTLATASPASAAPVTKSNATSAEVTGGSAERSVEFTTADFPASAVVTDVVVALDFTKIDNTGTGTSPTCGPPPVDGTLNERNDNLGYDLRSPAGTTISLIAFGTYTSVGFNGRITVTFDDAAASSPSGAPAAGTFRPSQALSGFDAETAIGTWTVIPKNNGPVTADPVCHYGFSLTVTAEVPPKATQSITFNPATTGTVGGSQVLAATATSGLPVAFSIDSSSGAGVCELNGSVLTYLKVGTCVVNADQAGNDSYEPADRVTRSVAVDLAVFNPGPSASITGLGRVGSTLTANAGSPSPTPSILGYRWFADGQQLSQVTRTLKLTSAHHGKRIQVRVYAIRSGYRTATSLSPATARVSSLQAKTISLELNDYTVGRGQRVYANLDELASGEPWSIVLDGTKLASGHADSTGYAKTSFVIPSTATLGIRTIRANGLFPDRTDLDRITIR